VDAETLQSIAFGPVNGPEAFHPLLDRPFQTAPPEPVWGARVEGMKAAGLLGISFVPCAAAKVVSFMTAKQTQATALYLIESAVGLLLMTAYTFDLDSHVTALIAACARGVQTSVQVDRAHTFAGVTKQMLHQMQRLSDAGVRVVLINGQYGGIQHSKVLRSDSLVIVGSTNWTGASAKNSECSCLIELDPAGVVAFEEWTTETMAKSIEFAEYMPPNLSSSQLDRYRTARKFSIARSRSVGP
jgi:phosphatidylserine/phosphatidylglycerophosphate/cardiolipin synthase-like enzyme